MTARPVKRSDNIFSEENDPCQEDMDDKVLLMESAPPEELSRHLLTAAETCARMTPNEIVGMQSEAICDAETQNEDLNGAQLHQLALAMARLQALAPTLRRTGLSG